MPNNTRRRNQPPTGGGKRSARRTSIERRLGTRSEVVQAQRHHPELNLHDVELPAGRSPEAVEAKRKAGR